MIPQIIVIGFYCIALGISLAKHGEPKNDNYSFGYSLTSCAFLFSMLYWGGFFDTLIK